MTTLRNAADVDEAPPDAAVGKSARDGAVMQARAACIHAALVGRTLADGPDEIIAKAERYWAWVSQAPADNRRRAAR